VLVSVIWVKPVHQAKCGAACNQPQQQVVAVVVAVLLLAASLEAVVVACYRAVVRVAIHHPATAVVKAVRVRQSRNAAC
jgi:hypothetical protein